MNVACTYLCNTICVSGACGVQIRDLDSMEVELQTSMNYTSPGNHTWVRWRKRQCIYLLSFLSHSNT